MFAGKCTLFCVIFFIHLYAVVKHRISSFDFNYSFTSKLNPLLLVQKPFFKFLFLRFNTTRQIAPSKPVANPILWPILPRSALYFFIFVRLLCNSPFATPIHQKMFNDFSPMQTTSSLEPFRSYLHNRLAVCFKLLHLNIDPEWNHYNQN